MKEAYLEGVLEKTGHLLTLLDRNPYSRTYGCFDRNYWHYKIKDFPSGMSQEFALALALVYAADFKGNPYCLSKTIRDWVLAAIRYAARSSHRDGSTDDYFPFEKALGAAVFSLHALTESYLLLEQDEPALLDFFRRRAGWVIKNGETGTLSNHHAIAAAALFNVFLVTREERFREAAAKKAREVTAAQSPEGWYPEYEGCDPGYLTVTIDFLARYGERSKDTEILDSLKRAVGFFAEIQHPDGTAGGDYGSRSTRLFHPNGFEILAQEDGTAARVANSYLEARRAGLIQNDSDDYILAHSLISDLSAYRRAGKRDCRELNAKRPGENRYYPKSGFLIRSGGGTWSIWNLLKGGTGKVFRGGRLVMSDAGVIARYGRKRLAVSSMRDEASSVEIGEEKVTVRKCLTRCRQHYAGPAVFILFRLVLLLAGRLPGFRNLLRSYLQRKMILGRRKLPFRYEREIRFLGGRIELSTEVSAARDITHAAVAPELVPIYVAAAECFHPDSLRTPWKDLVKRGEGQWALEETIA